MIFQDRKEAGQKLAQPLKQYKNALVLGLARGGVILAVEIGKSLHLPVDVLVVRKIGAPDNEELAIGAIGDVGAPYLNEELIALLGVSKEYIAQEGKRQRAIVQERKRLYSKDKPPLKLSGKTVILVDDGIATGASMKMAIQVVKAQHPSKLIVAVPVASPDSLKEIEKMADEVICLYAPASFEAVGAFYREFPQVTDQELIASLR